MAIRGVRGATVAEADQPELVLAATRQLLEAMLHDNPAMQPCDICSAFFTLTEDLRSVYPAAAAREMGWNQVPLLCAQEIPVPGSLPRCIRILLHWNTDLAQEAVHHVYLGQATCLRPDI